MRSLAGRSLRRSASLRATCVRVLGLRTCGALAPAIALAMLAAGCITPAGVDKSSAARVDAAAVVANLQTLLAGVPCDAKSVGDGTSENLKPIAQIEFDPATHGEIDLRGDWLLSARYQQGGFEVVNIADPANPVKMGFYQSEQKSAYDVKWMPDNTTAIVGHSRTVELVDVTPLMQPGLTPAQVEAANVSPTLISTYTYPEPPAGHSSTNMHMLATARIAGTDWVFIAPNDDTGIALLKLEGEGKDRKLTAVRHIADDPLSGGPLGPHDMSIVQDEILHKPILYIANGFEGWRAYDISDPAKPVSLAQMPNFGTAQGYTHTILGQKVGSKRLVATIQEVGSNTLTIWDATDFSKPVPVAQWTADKTDPTTPQHNIQLLDGKLYVSHYTKGMFVFDLKKLDTTPVAGTLSIKPMAHFAPVKKEGSASGPLNFANIWDVFVHRGVVYVNDVQAGTSVVGFGCLTPGDEMQTSLN